MLPATKVCTLGQPELCNSAIFRIVALTESAILVVLGIDVRQRVLADAAAQDDLNRGQRRRAIADCRHAEGRSECEILATVAKIEVLVQRSGSNLDDALKLRSNDMVSKLLSMPHSWLVISVCTKTHSE